jgi:hypothetical protein
MNLKTMKIVFFQFDYLLRSKPGIYRTGSTKRTPNLGKWNISTDKKNCIALTTWINPNITAFFELFPLMTLKVWKSFLIHAASPYYAAQPEIGYSSTSSTVTAPKATFHPCQQSQTPTKLAQLLHRQTLSLPTTPLERPLQNQSLNGKRRPGNSKKRSTNLRLTLKTSIKIMIKASLATQVKKIINATIIKSGNIENFSKHFITCQELQGIVQTFRMEMT